MFFSRSPLSNAKNLPSSGAVSDSAHARARAQLLSALPDAVFESTPSSVGSFVSVIQSFIYKPVAASAAALVFLAGGWMTTSAAQTSLPGDTLYNVKLITERAQLRVASLDRRAVLHTEFAGNRLEEVAELQRVSQEEPKRAQYIAETVTAYQQEIASATTDLQELQSQNQTQALTTATTVLDQVVVLTQSAGKLAIDPPKEINEETMQENTDTSIGIAEQVAQTTEAIADAATNVAIESHEVSPTDESQRQMSALFRTTLGDVEARRTMILHRIETIEKMSPDQKAILAQVGVVLPKKLFFTGIEKELEAMEANIPTIMDNFAAGGFRSALDALHGMENELVDIEKRLTLVEETIVNALMTPPETP